MNERATTTPYNCRSRFHARLALAAGTGIAATAARRYLMGKVYVRAEDAARAADAVNAGRRADGRGVVFVEGPAEALVFDGPEDGTWRLLTREEAEDAGFLGDDLDTEEARGEGPNRYPRNGGRN